MFNSFSDETINIDSLSIVIGTLQGKKEMEVFGFFKSVRKVCTSKQQEKFDKIIRKALKGGNQSPPREGEMPPPPR